MLAFQNGLPNSHEPPFELRPVIIEALHNSHLVHRLDHDERKVQLAGPESAVGRRAETVVIVVPLPGNIPIEPLVKGLRPPVEVPAFNVRRLTGAAVSAIVEIAHQERESEHRSKPGHQKRHSTGKVCQTRPDQRGEGPAGHIMRNPLYGTPAPEGLQ